MTVTASLLRKIVAEHLGRDSDAITAESIFGSDLGAESFDTIELTMIVEEEFGIELTDDEALAAFAVEATFGQALALVDAKLAEKVRAV